jgi:GWxTD domain-containing protein
LSSNRPPYGAERGPSGPLFFALLFLSLLAFPVFAADNALSWIKSPEAYFLTAEERTQWDQKVVSPQDAQRFIDEFRRRRGEQFVKDVHSREEFADKQFALGKRPGALTERGRVLMILGPPSEVKTIRDNSGAQTGPVNDSANTMQNSNLERKSVVVSEWIYKSDRLPKDLGMPELVVRFQTNFGRGQETIENPGLVEPYLKKVAAFISSHYIDQAARLSAAPAPAAAGAAGPDPLWAVTPSANGAIYTGETFISPTDRPFYAASFFVPQSATGFGEWKSALLVSLIRDANGLQVVSDRSQVDLQAYDASGNRYVDRSFELPPGKYDAVFALYSPEGSSMLASWREQFDVLPATTQRASKLFVTSRIDTLDKQSPFDPFTFVATKYAVRGDRRFKTTDKIGFVTVVQSPTGDTPKLVQKMTMTKDGKPFFKSPPEDAALTQTGPKSYLVGITFDPSTFKPGHYAVELQLRDMNAAEGSDLRGKGHVVNAEFDVVQ